MLNSDKNTMFTKQPFRKSFLKVLSVDEEGFGKFHGMQI